MATPHNQARQDQVARSVLFPGDPLRAEFIAKEYLADSERVTSVRNVFGFTGTWKGERVTVMASGMGGASAGIYSYELFKLYGVERIIRIGTAGGLQGDLAVGDVVLAMTASTDSGYAGQYRLPGTLSPACDYSLLERAVAVSRERSVRHRVGAVFSSDYFSEYNAMGAEESWKPWARMGCLAQDMETYALYCNAAWLGGKALSILTHTDSCVSGEGLPPERRMSALRPMIEIALEVAL
jgi:purine-nucleoside phosphorylase